MQLHLFDHMVVPVLLRGSEIWGFDGNITIEKLQLKFCRMLPRVNNKIRSVRFMVNLADYHYSSI